MRIENDIKILEPGDKIRCQNILAEIATIHYQDYDSYTNTFITEFHDTNGELRNWHQHSDGGVAIPKPATKFIYVGFEKQNADGDNNINNYDAMQIFENEQDALNWKCDNADYRTYKYCGQIAV